MTEPTTQQEQQKLKPEGISVVMITKNCAVALKECLDSLRGFISKRFGDELVIVDTGSTDGTQGVAAAAGARVIERPDLCKPGMLALVKNELPDEFEKLTDEDLTQFEGGFLDDFAGARQIANDEAVNNLVLWIDSDDVLIEPTKLRKYAAAWFADEKNTALFLNYRYSFDEADGACTTELWRERICRKDKYEWKGVCHESMIPRSGQPEVVNQCPVREIEIVHKNHRGTQTSDVRNYAILLNAYKEADWKDPRWEFYLGNAARGMGRYTDALHWYTLVLRHSGSRDDRFSATMNCGAIYMLQHRAWKALDWFWQAAKIFTGEPRAYFSIARAYYEIKKYEECLMWTGVGQSLSRPNVLTAVDPQGYDYYPKIFEAMALKELKQWQLALQAAQEACQMRPGNPGAEELFNSLQAEFTNEKTRSVLMSAVGAASSPEGARRIIKSIKPEIRKGFEELQIESRIPKQKRRITYLCGTAVERWDGTSKADGIGGSEKMVIMLAEAWAKKGWGVDVYGYPKKENAYKEINGVRYCPVESFDPKFPRNIIIVWRNHSMLDFPIKAKKIFVDLHDVQQPDFFTADRIDKVDCYFFKSEFHAESVRSAIPAEKLIVTRNGIDLEHFKQEVPERNLKKFIYCSSADRGLLGTLKLWQRLEKDADAELHIFYGFNDGYFKKAARQEYQWFGEEDCERHMLDYWEECMLMMDRMPSVTFHDRVSHEELAREMLTASAWIYPTKFPEISCMVAMETQAAGVIPIVTPTGALDETVQFGHKVDHPDKIVSHVRDILSRGHDLDTYRIDMASWAQSAFDINTLATEWIEFFNGKKQTNQPAEAAGSDPRPAEPAAAAV